MKKNGNAERRARGLSLLVAAGAFLALAGIEIVIFRGMHARDVLENSNTLERVMNSLFASLRDHDDFGSAIESSPELEAQVSGLGVYALDGSRIYSWGEVPPTWISPPETRAAGANRDRSYVANPKGSSFILLIHPFRLAPPPPPEARDGPKEAQGRKDAEGGVASDKREPRDEHGFLFDTLRTAEVVYLEVRTPAYWRAELFRNILFPVVLAALAALVLFVRSLILRNADYRRRIDEQRNLVVLGTAAATLAHEIKNPLLSIRLQSSILERVCPEEGRHELEVINGEVERLSALAYRINDYLREPRGKPGPVDALEVARDVGLRLAGRDLVAPGAGQAPAWAWVDRDRLRSILENVVGNAIESGGQPEGLSIEVPRPEGRAEILVLDRGPGIPEADRQRVFDPFFTTKSRGTGIGLAVSRRFALAAGGDIAIEAREGGGCAVRVVLPAAAEGGHR